MKVSVKTTSGEFYQVTIPDNSTISDLKMTAVVASASLKSSNLNFYNLYFKGIRLDLLKNVSNYGILDNDTIVIGSKVPQDNVLQKDLAPTAPVVPKPEDNATEQDAVPKPEDNLKEELSKAENATPTRSKSPIASASTHTITKKKKSAKNSKKCNFANCNSASLRIIGNCQDCNGNFCSKHRLMENHLCSGLLNIKKIAFNRNANKLQQEQTISQKV